MTDELLHLSQDEYNVLIAQLPPSCTNITLLAKGKRGVIFKAEYEHNVVAIKTIHPHSKANNTLLLEANMLTKVNALGIGPTLLRATEQYVIMEFIHGTPIGEWILLIQDAKKLVLLFTKLFDQLFLLDTHNINKFELTNPYKHILITNTLEPVQLDFERARITHRPKNITQFAQYITRQEFQKKYEELGLNFDASGFETQIKDYAKTAQSFSITSFFK